MIGEPIVLSDQLVSSVIRIGDRDGAPGDGGYVPVVVVGVGIGRVATVLVHGEQRMETFDTSNEAVKGIVLLTPFP